MSERRISTPQRVARLWKAASARAHGVVALVVVTAMMSLTAVLSPPAVAAPEVTTADELAGLRSEPAPKSAAVAPSGDFSNPPDPSSPPSRSTPRESSFDPAKSIPIDAETTPTQRVYADESGTKTSVLNQKPVRFQRDGSWVDIDQTLVAGPDGTLAAKAAPAGPTLAARADGAVATIDTASGPIVLRHAQAAPVAATADDATATYAKALSGNRDLVITLTADGFEEKVILPDAAAEGTYHDEFTLLIP